MMEVESGNHEGQTILLSYIDKNAYCHYSAISGTTTSTFLSLTVIERIPNQTAKKSSEISSLHEHLYLWQLSVTHNLQVHHSVATIGTTS